LDADFNFENMLIHWTTEAPDLPGASQHGIGAYFEGDKGTLMCDYSTRSITINGETVSDLPEIVQSIPRSPGHQQNFVNAVKSRTPPESNLEYAREMTLPMHLAIISWRLGRKINWDWRHEKCVDDKEANKLLARKYRKKWDLL
jgi:hypothetical protein